jgi:hypothetical protein
MIEKIRISLWDLFAYFLSGVLVLFSGVAHFVALAKIRWGDLVSIEKVPTPVLFFVAFVGPPLVGMLAEPVANIIDDGVEWLHRRIMRLLGRQREIDERLEKLHKDLGDVIRREHMPATLAHIIDPYQWCKDYLVQYDKPTPYMAFLGKFGFYRNAAVITVANAVILPLVYGLTIRTSLTALGLLILSLFLYVRSLRFSEHLVRAIYQHYLIAVTVSALHLDANRRSETA